MVDTLYGEIPNQLELRFNQCQLLVCDVDGVFSDGRIYLGNNGEELKAFHTKDGFGVKALINTGVQIAVITGRESNIVEQRMRSLGVKTIVQGCEHKLPALYDIGKSLNIEMQQTAFIGDDMPDFECLKAAGIGIAVDDAHPTILESADYVTKCRGGFGAVREVADLIMLFQNTLESASASSV